MDFMKILDQTVRTVKREVNLKVLKVPEIEQKVLDATSDEPWGPHGSELAEIAQATKKFSECQIVMNVLRRRLTETGPNWRHVYKALSVIEYLVANGSERAVDDIIEHTFQISSLSGFEYAEPNGKDSGINIRKKVETMLALLNDREKIKAVRDKAASTRDKYIGLSSTGITYKSSAASYSGSNFSSSTRYGGPSSRREVENSKEDFQGRNEEFGENCDSQRTHETTKKNYVNGIEGSRSKWGITDKRRDQGASRKQSVKQSFPVSSKIVDPQLNKKEDDFDDFDPRGSSVSAAATANQVNLFGDSLVDILDLPDSSPAQTDIRSTAMAPEVNLFADADFVPAPHHAANSNGSPTLHYLGDQLLESNNGETGLKDNIDLFASRPDALFPSPIVDLFDMPDSVPMTATTPALSEMNMCASFTKIAANSSEESDLFGAFTSNTDTTRPESLDKSASDYLNNLNQPSSASPARHPKKDTFQVKSGIWADSLSRGLIDLNFSASQKTSHEEIGTNTFHHVNVGSSHDFSAFPSAETGDNIKFPNPTQQLFDFGDYK